MLFESKEASSDDIESLSPKMSPSSSKLSANISLITTGTEWGGILPTSHTIIDKYFYGVKSYFRFNSSASALRPCEDLAPLPFYSKISKS